jgi:hypothetical protein
VCAVGSTNFTQAGSPLALGNGTETVTVRLKAPIGFGPMKFARLRLTAVDWP